MQEATYYIKIFIALLVLVNPFEGLPIFLSNTRGQTREQKKAISKKTSVAVFAILLISLFFGRYILTLFGISIPSFSLAGGIIILIIALQMVLGKTNSGEKSLPDSPDQDSDIAIVPLAIPLLAGPGAISSIIVYGSRSTGIIEDIILTGIVVLVAAVILIFFGATTRLEKVFTPTRIKIITKISGLLVAAIAIELISSSVTSLIKIHQANP